jgi:cytochrome P450
MRLYPTIISTLPRVLDVELMVGNGKYRLPAGTKIGMQNYVHHRDPEVFPAPEQFLPERWLGGSTKEMVGALTPFSLGPRSCLGQNLGAGRIVPGS